MLIFSTLFLLLSNAVSSLSSEQLSPSNINSHNRISEEALLNLGDNAFSNNYSKTKGWDKSILYSRVAIIILLYSALLSYICLNQEALGKGIAIYGGLFHITSTSLIFQIFIFLLSGAILQLTAFYPRKVWLTGHSTMYELLFNRFFFNKSLRREILNKNGEQFHIIEYSLIMLLTVTGAIFLQSSSDLVSIFLAIELQSYGLYLLSTIYRNSEQATGGGLTYFLLGGLSSCFILLGISLLYANSGTTNLDGLYIIKSLSELAAHVQISEANVLDSTLSDSSIHYVENSLWYNSDYIDSSLVILSVGFLFKISAAPFHFWSPDVYDAIPTIVTTFVAIVAKISILILLLELVHYTTNSLFTLDMNSSITRATLGSLTQSSWLAHAMNMNYSWSFTILSSSFLSLIVGTVVGLSQIRIKRLFAYSTISHVGFILLALSINSIESIQGFIFYIMQYSISNLNAFMIIISIGYSLYYYINDNKEYLELKDKNNSPIQLISQMKGYFEINKYLALSLAITIFSFAGIPPLVGFFAKQMVLSSALDSGYLFLTLVAILTSVIGGVYYLGIIKQVFFDKSDYKLNPELDACLTSLGKDLTGFSINTLSGLPELKDGGADLYNRKGYSYVSYRFKLSNIMLSSYLSITISILTLIILLFIFIPSEWLNMANILALILWNS
jgi:NADH-ubiquinone oxidoreductase chain 2